MDLLFVNLAETSNLSRTEDSGLHTLDSCHLNLYKVKEYNLVAFDVLSASQLQRECASLTISLIGGSGVRRCGTIDDRVSSEVGKLRDGSQQATGVCKVWENV